MFLKVTSTQSLNKLVEQIAELLTSIYSVVAEEVRELALNSADATGNIETSLEMMKELIEKILTHMENINQLVDTQADLALTVRETIENVNRMSGNLKEIAKQSVNTTY